MPLVGRFQGKGLVFFVAERRKGIPYFTMLGETSHLTTVGLRLYLLKTKRQKGELFLYTCNQKSRKHVTLQLGADCPTFSLNFTGPTLLRLLYFTVSILPSTTRERIDFSNQFF